MCDCGEFSFDTEITYRGPDSYDELFLQNNIQLIGCVLSLRGATTVRQPLCIDDTYLLWNGECYGNNIYSQVIYDLQQNDTKQVLEKLKESNPLQVFSEIEGCFAFVLCTADEVWFGRDFLGKRSLVVGRNKEGYTISSVGPGTQVPTGGIFRVSLLDNTCEFIAWPHPGLVTPSSIRFGSPASPHCFAEALTKSVELRLIGTSEIGVLFSGGLDCTVIAALAHRYLPVSHKIYLLNVAFARDAPDRTTGLSSFLGLRDTFSDRDFCLILIDIEEAEIEGNKDRIINLMGKNNSRMDFSIAAALFFASRGQGVDFESGEKVLFPGRILLSGMGADEIFGGYSRYKSSYLHYGCEGIVREMSLDIDRLWHRNLGRDDRVTACHGKELRFPYLDTHLWQALSALPLEEVTQPYVPGRDKIALREYAESIGLGFVSGLKKRAIQFGTRISQVCNLKDFGSNRKAKGWQNMSGDKGDQIQKEVEWCCKELSNKIKIASLEEKGKIEEAIQKLQDESVKVKDKRHIMRVFLGDYVSTLGEIGNDE